MEEKREIKGSFGRGLVVGIALTLFIVCALVLLSKVKDLVFGNGNSEVEFVEDSAITPTMVSKLQLLEKTIDHYFYLHDVTDEAVEEAVYKGMLEALDDPYSEYYTAEELADLMEQSEGIYYGIGAYVSLDTATSLPKITGV